MGQRRGDTEYNSMSTFLTSTQILLGTSSSSKNQTTKRIKAKNERLRDRIANHENCLAAKELEDEIKLNQRRLMTMKLLQRDTRLFHRIRCKSLKKVRSSAKRNKRNTRMNENDFKVIKDEVVSQQTKLNNLRIETKRNEV